MREGQLLICPQCIAKGRKQVLGNLKPDGSLLIMRFNSGTTIIKATTLTLQCGCGYPIHITEGAIESAYIPV